MKFTWVLLATTVNSIPLSSFRGLGHNIATGLLFNTAIRYRILAPLGNFSIEIQYFNAEVSELNCEA